MGETLLACVKWISDKNYLFTHSTYPLFRDLKELVCTKNTIAKVRKYE